MNKTQISFLLPELQYIVTLLENQPFKDVAQLLESIKTQFDQQTKNVGDNSSGA